MLAMQRSYAETDLANACGVDVESIVAFEQMGLLQQPRRRPGRREVLAYHQEHLERLRFIVHARKLGFTFEAIGGMLGVDGGMRTCADTYRIAQRHLAEVRRTSNPAEISKVERELMPLVEACPQKGGASNCPIIARLSHVG